MFQSLGTIMERGNGGERGKGEGRKEGGLGGDGGKKNCYIEVLFYICFLKYIIEEDSWTIILIYSN